MVHSDIVLVNGDIVNEVDPLSFIQLVLLV